MATEVVPKCDICGKPDGPGEPDWNGETGCHATCEANEIVCRHCGSNDLASIEKSIDWQRVTFVKTDDGIEVQDDTWGDIVGDSSSETIGAVCIRCYAEEYDEPDAAPDEEPRTPATTRAFVTRSEFDATHPVKTWTVQRRRLGKTLTWMVSGHIDEGALMYWSNDQGWVDHASADRYDTNDGNLPDGGRWVPDKREEESDSVTVEARTQWNAMERAGEYGMVDGRYPWRPISAEEA